ncbi:MAG: aminotransferase class V-fold PLP-dependent enzyme, partial [Rhodospirillales bacterium]|nr:aminotransferase class V-fold PLP-dependent enzyme [Rhodospirillales bacterium]
MTATPLFDPADFRIPEGVAHLCAGGQTPFLHAHDAALLRHSADKSNGMAGRAVMEAEVERARSLVARLWGVETADIGFVAHVAEGVAMLAESLDWRPGDTIAVDAAEYPSVVGGFALRKGVGLRVAEGDAPDRLAACVDGSTRLIAASYVSYLTGERTDLAALRRAADRVGALLLVDYTQASCCMAIDPTVADFAFSACYKWMLGMTGIAVAYWNRARQPNWAPVSAGWYSIAPGSRSWTPPPALRDDAMRFTRGNPAHASAYVLASALDYLTRFDPHAVQRHVLGLGGALIERLAAWQIPVWTPADPARRAANVCLRHPRAAAIAEALEMQRVLVWNGQ